MTLRETYAENVKRELDRLDDELEAFETKVTPARLEARDGYAMELARLRRHSLVALRTWEALLGSSDVSWHQRVSDMDRACDDFIHAFHRFRSRL